MISRGCALLLVALCVGCSANDTGSTWTGSVTDSAGVTVVSNPNEGLWGDEDRWTVEQDLVIGEIEGDPDYLFGRIAGICVDSDRRIYVLDALASRIAVYDSDGVFQNAFGEGGAGPGELGANAGPCLIGPGDTLTVPDITNGRVNQFTSGGSYVGGARLDMREGLPYAWRMMGDGRIARQVRAIGARGEPLDGTPDEVFVGAVDGSARDTLLTFVPGKTVTAENRGMITVFSAEPDWDIAPNDDILFGKGDDYRIERRDAVGNLTHVVTKQFDRVPIEESDRQAVGDAAAAWLGDFPISQVIRFAEYYPAFYRLRSGPRGSLWVQHVIRPTDLTEGEQGDITFALSNLGVMFLMDPRLAFESRDWDLFDAEGRFLGVVTLPTRFRQLTFVDDEIYGVWKNELDVEHVMRLKVVIPE